MQNPSDNQPAAGPSIGDFWGAQTSGVIGEMLRTASIFALSDLGVRIVGEKGTGRLYLARLIHHESPRCAASFTRVKCEKLDLDRHESSIFGTEHPAGGGEEGAAPGILETSRGGTVYFDMFEYLPAAQQQKLYRAMEMRHFRRSGGSNDVNLDVRIITGMTKVPGQPLPGTDDPSWVISRPMPVSINIPPLRERREDIESLIYLFLLENHNNHAPAVTGITAEALRFCRNYSWPGNIYELRNVIRHSVTRAGEGRLKAEDLPEYIRTEEHAGIQPAPAGAGGRS